MFGVPNRFLPPPARSISWKQPGWESHAGRASPTLVSKESRAGALWIARLVTTRPSTLGQINLPNTMLRARGRVCPRERQTQLTPSLPERANLPLATQAGPLSNTRVVPRATDGADVAGRTLG